MLQTPKIIFLTLFTVFVSLFFGMHNVNAAFLPDNNTKTVLEKYHFTETKLEAPLTRKEFLESLFQWFVDYKASKGITLDTGKFSKVDSKNFTDLNLESDFGKKLQYFVELKAFTPREKFNPQTPLTQTEFFVIMKRLGVMDSLQTCIDLVICDQESTSHTLFNRGTYYEYISKILHKEFRKRLITSSEYWSTGFRPLLATNYAFPLKQQSLNACYFYSARNIYAYKTGKNFDVESILKKTGKDPKTLSNWEDQKKFDTEAHLIKEEFYNIETLFSSLQKGEPIAISYMLSYKNKRGETVTVSHVTAAYSFDDQGIWVAETVSGKRVRVAYSEVFDGNGKVRYRPMRKFHVQ